MTYSASVTAKHPWLLRRSLVYKLRLMRSVAGASRSVWPSAAKCKEDRMHVVREENESEPRDMLLCVCPDTIEPVDVIHDLGTYTLRLTSNHSCSIRSYPL